MLRDVAAAMLKTLGPDHHDTLQMESVLAQTLGLEDKFAEAEQLLRNTLESERLPSPCNASVNLA